MSGRFLNINMTVTNYGLADADESKIEIYADENLIKEIDLIPVNIGTGRIITVENIFVQQMKVNEFEIEITANFSELSKENNKIKLEIK